LKTNPGRTILAALQGDLPGSRVLPQRQPAGDGRGPDPHRGGGRFLRQLPHARLPLVHQGMLGDGAPAAERSKLTAMFCCSVGLLLSTGANGSSLVVLKCYGFCRRCNLSNKVSSFCFQICGIVLLIYKGIHVFIHLLIIELLFHDYVDGIKDWLFVQKVENDAALQSTDAK